MALSFNTRTLSKTWRAVAAPSSSLGLNWHYVFVPLLLAAALSVLSLQYRYGVGLAADSAFFISAAKSVLGGHGLTTDIDGMRLPLAHHPPLYPLLLAAASAVVGGFLSAGTAINFVSFLCCFAAAYFFVARNGSGRWALAALALLACSTALYFVHYFLGTDAPAIPFMLAGMCCLAESERTETARNVVFAALALAAASLTRYAYAAFIPAGCLVVLLDGNVEFRRRLRLVSLFAIVSCAPLLTLVLHNLLLDGNPTNRSLALHPVSLSRLLEGADYLSSWLLPYRIPMAVRLAALLGVAALGMLLAVRGPLKTALRITTSFLLAYLIFLLVSISLFDFATPLDERMLAPAVVLLCLHLTLTASWLSSAGRWRAGPLAGVLLVLVPCGVGAMRLIPRTAALYGNEDAAKSISKLRGDFRDILPLLRMLPASGVVYSNVANDIYLVSDRGARNLPTVRGYTDARPRTEQEISAQVQALARNVGGSGGLVIYRLRPETLLDRSLIGCHELCRRVPLKQVFRSRGFLVLGLPAAAVNVLRNACTPAGAPGKTAGCQLVGVAVLSGGKAAAA